MSRPRRIFGERLLRVAIRSHPAWFRQTYGDEMLDYYREAVSRETGVRGRMRALRFLSSSLVSALREGARQRRRAPAARERVLQGFRGDLRSAWRVTRRHPGFAVAVLTVLTLGLGANTAVFGALDAVLLRPLPYPDPDRLVRLYQVDTDAPDELEYVTAPAFQHFREHHRTLAALEAVYTYDEQGADVTDGFRATRLRVLRVTPGYLPMLGITPVRGRLMQADDERGSPVALARASIAEQYAEGASESQIRLDGVLHELIGVLPDTTTDPLVGAVDVWRLLPVDSTRSDGDSWASWQWDNHYLTVVGRLRPDVAIEAAASDVERLAVAQGGIEPDAADLTGVLRPLHADLRGSSSALLWLLSGAVSLLFLIACVNVTGLIVARGAGRRREVAVRAALGASRLRLARQVVIEIAGLALAAGVAGAALGYGLSHALSRLAPDNLLAGGLGAFNLRVFVFVLLLAVVSGVAAALIPALRLTAINLDGVMREEGRTGGQARTEGRMRSGLVVAQIAVSLVLLVGAGLVLRTLAQLQRVDLGFRPASVWTFDVNLPASRYDAPARIRFHRELQDRLRASGLDAVAALSHVPATGSYLSWGVRRAGQPERFTGANQRVVEGDIFSLLGIRVRAGRVFGATEDADAPRRVVINELLADRLFGDETPIGQRVVVAGDDLEVIGVVGNAAIDARGEVAPVVYHAHRQFGDNRNWRMALFLSTDDPARALQIVGRELTALDPALVAFRPRALDTVVSRGRARERFAASLLGGFAVLAGLLSAIGLYGTLASGVARRRREFAVRLALGAGRWHIYGQVAGRGAALAAAGIAVGLVGAWLGAGALDALLFDVQPHDPAVFASAAIVLAVVAFAASWLPARAATRIDAAAEIK